MVVVCYGTYCYQFLFLHNLHVKLYSHNELDICDNTQIELIIANNDIIINCAAYTNVDKAEYEDKELCIKVNSIAVSNIAFLCKKYNHHLIHISSNFVYGNVYNKNNYEELFEDDILNPINVYRKFEIRCRN